MSHIHPGVEIRRNLTTGTYSLRFRDPESLERSTVNTHVTDRDKALEMAKVTADMITAKKQGFLVDKVYASLKSKHGTQTMSGLLETYRERKTYMNSSAHSVEGVIGSIRRWLVYSNLESAHPSAVSPQSIYRYINRPGDTTMASRVSQLKTIRSFMKWCHNCGYVDMNVSVDVSVNTEALTTEQKIVRIKRAYTREELMKIMEACSHGRSSFDPFWKDACYLSWETGLRFSDICLLEWSSVDLDGNCITVPTKKGGWRRSALVKLAMSDPLVHMFTELHRERDIYTARVWPLQAALYLQQKGAGRCSLINQFKSRCEWAGVEYLGFHSFRRAYAQRTMKEIVKSQPPWAVAQVQQQLGHASPRTTETYLQTTT